MAGFCPDRGPSTNDSTEPGEPWIPASGKAQKASRPKSATRPFSTMAREHAIFATGMEQATHERREELRSRVDEDQLRLKERALSLALGGALHRLGNLFGLFGAHVELLDRGGEPAARRLKPHQLERLRQASQQYHEVGDLLGLLGRKEATVDDFCAGSQLNALHATLVCDREGQRVPVVFEREARVWTRGDPALFLTAVVLANHALIEQAPAALKGALTWKLRRRADRGELRIDFVLGPSQLPFRLETARLDARTVVPLRKAAWSWSPADEGLGIVIDFPAQDAPRLA